jgi:phosphonate transport system substrate-binding protein
MKLMGREAIAMITVAASTMIGAGGASADWREDVAPFRIGILGGQLVEMQLREHACLRTRAEQALGVPVELAPSRDYTGIYEGLHDGSIDAAGISGAGYAGLFIEDPDLVEPLVAPKQEDGLLGYHSVLLVRTDSPYRSLEDLHDRSLAFTERLSASGFLIPFLELTEQGFTPHQFFGRLAFTGGHPQAVMAVLEGAYDAGVTWSSMAGDPERGFSRGNLRRMVDRGLLDMSDVRILWKSELIPADPHVVRKAVPEEAKDLYRQLLLDLAERDSSCFRNIVGDGAVDFEVITHEHYDNIIDIRRNGLPGDS